MSEYRKTVEGEMYFVTLTVVGWVDVFARSEYRDILIENLKYCQANEGLSIYAYVIMSNHVHLIVKRDHKKSLTELLGRFKSHTAKKILKLIENNPKESRKEWLLYLFKYFAKRKKQYKNFHFWQNTNRPIELYSNAVIDQKIDYIHQNPVVAGIVSQEFDYRYSSAHPDGFLELADL